MMGLFEGTYVLKHDFSGGSYAMDSDWNWWRCTLTFDQLEVEVRAKTRRGALRKAVKAMAKAVKLRTAIRSVKGLCDE